MASYSYALTNPVFGAGSFFNGYSPGQEITHLYNPKVLHQTILISKIIVIRDIENTI
jgi:hypothetical protein